MSVDVRDRTGVEPAQVLTDHPIDTTTDIGKREDLKNHLLQAAALEMQTIPMYLYSMYSIQGRGRSRWDPGMGAARLIRSIVVEEMLHLCLVRNILVALGHGDDIRLCSRTFVPSYPQLMLHRHPPLTLQLQPCTRQVVADIFMEFERPKARPEESKPGPGEYATIGQFYKAVIKGLEDLADEHGPELWRDNRPDRQYVSGYWNKDGGGEPVKVTNLSTAKQAMKLIVDQGEGINPERPTVPIDPLEPRPGDDELPHYTKFSRIAEGIEPIGPVWDVPVNPKSEQYVSDPAATSINTLFNAAYCYTLHLLDTIYGVSRADVVPGASSHRYRLERTFISAMQGVLANLAETMVAHKIHKGPLAGRRIGPTFEYVELPADGKKDHLRHLCNEAMADFPQLGGDNGVRWLLDKMPDV
ncbi:ferritin-like protein [Actinomadura sp. 6K520]|uniref:ferritin-like domain-containing protein n=1 Tax=Actinomadura sp. 6K520 TaxID=2530364 RepID=UPI001051252B|nr:ferritin-like protein [Actinomadura sp. 6K520]TDE35689.1 hypothetical protein E1289_07405 [Actinomadura sp. 6K520]